MKNFIIKILNNNKFTYSYILYFRYLLLKKKCERKRKSNIFMLHIGRAGSTVLADLLSQHSKIHWDGEFYPNQDKTYFKFIYENPVKFLKIRMNQNINDFYGFELKSSPKQLGYNSINVNLDAFFSEILKINFNHFIILERKNYLKQLISYKFAKETKIHHIKQPAKLLRTIAINPENSLWFKEEKTLIQHFEYLDGFYKNAKNLIKNEKYLFLTYEDDILNNPNVAYEKICNFLEIEYQNPKVNLKRTNPFPLKEVIENFEEVEKCLKGTKYEWMLYD